MKKAVLYVHGKGGNSGEAEHYRPLFPGCDVLGFDYRANTPWDAENELPGHFERLTAGYDSIVLIANSIGAYFSMLTLSDKKIDAAFFISPVVDMEKLICSMMRAAGVTEEELLERGEIPTELGETLSWRYLEYVRAHPVVWKVPTHILYGENDCLTSYDTVSGFAKRIGASLTVMGGGEHWFHTEEQMHFLDCWVTEKIKTAGNIR